jgi:hypothetical protein
MRKGYFDQSDSGWIIPITDKYGHPLDLGKDRTRSAKIKEEPEKKIYFTVERCAWIQQSDLGDKIIVLQMLRFEEKRGLRNKREIRFCYYTTSRTGHWWWGQFAVMIPQSDFEELLDLAREKGFFDRS